jgi:hypothetical protein
MNAKWSHFYFYVQVWRQIAWDSFSSAIRRTIASVVSPILKIQIIGVSQLAPMTRWPTKIFWFFSVSIGRYICWQNSWPEPPTLHRSHIYKSRNRLRHQQPPHCHFWRKWSHDHHIWVRRIRRRPVQIPQVSQPVPYTKTSQIQFCTVVILPRFLFTSSSLFL